MYVAPATSMPPGQRSHPARRPLRRVTILGAFAVALGPGCSPEDLPPSAALRRALTDGDGDRVVAAGVSILNRYARLTEDVQKGATQLSVTLGDLASLSLVPDDLLMIIQMQGA